jgi:hypothetical protein
VWEPPYKTLTFAPQDGCFVDVQQLQEVVAVLQPSDFNSKHLDTNPPYVVLSQPVSLIHKSGLFLLANGKFASGHEMEEMTLECFGQDLVAEITRTCICRNYEEAEERGDQQTKWNFSKDGSSSSSSKKKMKKSNAEIVMDNNPFCCDISSISSSSVNRNAHHEEEGIYII